MFTVALGIVVLLIALLIDSDNFKFIVKPEYQVIVGTIVIAIILFDDALPGLLFGLAVIIMYSRVIARKAGINLDLLSLLNKNNANSANQSQNPKYNYTQETKLQQGSAMRKLVKDSDSNSDYVSPANLLDAQNNIIDTKNYNNAYIGIPEIYGQPVYSAEGADVEGDTNVEGYDASIYVGSTVKR